MEGSPTTKISLIDLSSQMPFEMGVPIDLIRASVQSPDDDIKEQICFGETLIISCTHYDGEIGGENESSDSEWSCQDTESESLAEVKDDKSFEVKDRVEEEQVLEKAEEENDDFYFYFFPDCALPVPPQDSDASLIIVDGLPQMNPNAAKFKPFCICEKTKGDECECIIKLPCKCGAKEQAECKCGQLETICVCRGGDPSPKCVCGKNKEVCVCHPGQIRATCTCDQIDKPCICHPGKFPYPVCPCKFKPKFEELKSIGEEYEPVIEETEQLDEEHVSKEEEEESREPCVCQQPEPKPHCLCIKGKDCICNDKSCICGVQKTCVCEPTDEEVICRSRDSKTICSCDVPLPDCTCEAEGIDCTCFRKSIRVCNCGNPEDCKCFSVCECADPCICDTAQMDPLACICLDQSKKAETGLVCTCPRKKEQTNKLKKVKAGKDGYRWCHDVDPRHTFFDYGYDRHDKIAHKEKETEKVHILGLHDAIEGDEVCAVHGSKVPPFKKKIRKPSIDCCSSVGGISISIECLGEDKDKFLVQVVSHASKEGAKTGSKLVSILDCNLHTMEENRSEHITKRDLTKERRNYVAICESGYYNKVTRVCGDRSVVKRHYHTFEDSKNFLLEGANVVLMRFFALRRFRGTIRTETVMMDGTICESIYVSNGVSQGVVNGKPLFVVKVERHILEPSGYVHQTLTVLTMRGYIVSHEWADSAYIMHINPLLEVNSSKDFIEPHEPLRERWREDLQLLSDYLDHKSARTSEGGRYMMESGALTATVRDYLQALLLLRPQDALHFTRHYFGSVLSALDLPHDDYFDPTSKHVRYYFFEE